MLRRLWIYQRERFPIHVLGFFALVLAYSTIAFSSLTRAADVPSVLTVLAAAASAFLILAQMRVLDEFKDAEDDALHRPYRPVPRGLVTLAELRRVLVTSAIALVLIALAVDPRLLWLLAALWGYLSLMTAEFFVRDWLRARPFAYFATHNPIGLLISVYLSAFEWLPSREAPHPALAFLALASLFDWALHGLGRKIRAPQDEEPGVLTYSTVWGKTVAATAWLTVLLLASIAGGLAARAIGFAAGYAALMSPVALIAGFCCLQYLRRPDSRRARRIEAMTGVATIVLYVALGPIPWFLAR